MNARTLVHSPTTVPENPTLYWVLWFCGIGIIITLLSIAWLKWNSLLFGDGALTFNTGPTCLVLAVMFVVLSINQVDVDEIAGALCYGKALKRLKAGPQFAPFLLMQIKKEGRTVREFQCPDEPENVFKGQDDQPLTREGMSRPIRVITKAPEPGKGSTEILDTQMTLVISFVFQYVVSDILNFRANFGTDEVVRIQLRDIGEVTVAEDATMKTTSEFIRGLKELNERLVVQVQERFQNSGITILSARLISPDVSHDVSKELANIAAARAKAEQKVITAGAERAEFLLHGEGKAGAEKSMLVARAEGSQELMKALKIDGNAVIASEAVRALSDKTDVLVVGAEGGMRDVMGLVKGAQSALGSARPTKPAKGVPA